MNLQLLQDLGLPVAGTIALAWFVLYLVKWMQSTLIMGLLDSHNELVKELNEVEQRVIDDNKINKDILIKLNDSEKANDIKLSELASNLETMLKFIKNGKK